ncbi:MAG: MarC family protein [Planctomycetota bacterium]
MQLFAIADPFASVPFLIAARKANLDLRKVCLMAVLSAYIVAVVCALVGPLLFSVFGVSIDSFRVAGGLVLLLMAVQIARDSDSTRALEPTGADALIAILATPMLTGPAMISFITLKVRADGAGPVLLNVTAAFVLVGLVIVALAASLRWINVRVMSILSRVLGLFLAAIGVELIAAGVRGLLSAPPT